MCAVEWSPCVVLECEASQGTVIGSWRYEVGDSCAGLIRVERSRVFVLKPQVDRRDQSRPDLHKLRQRFALGWVDASVIDRSHEYPDEVAVQIRRDRQRRAGLARDALIVLTGSVRCLDPLIEELLRRRGVVLPVHDARVCRQDATDRRVTRGRRWRREEERLWAVNHFLQVSIRQSTTESTIARYVAVAVAVAEECLIQIPIVVDDRGRTVG